MIIRTPSAIESQGYVGARSEHALAARVERHLTDTLERILRDKLVDPAHQRQRLGASTGSTTGPAREKILLHDQLAALR